MNIRSVIAKTMVYFILCTFLVVVVFPMLWLFYTSLKTDQAIFINPFDLPTLDNLQWKNFAVAWTKASFGQYFFNSVIVTASTMAFSLLFSSMAAYALARFIFPGARFILLFFIAGMMIPLQLSIIPLFFQMKAMHLLSTRHGLIMVYIAFSMPFSIFVLTGFFKTLPSSVYEAAIIDGAAEWGAFWYVMLPLARPGLVTVSIFNFLGIWSEYFMAFMFLNGEKAEKISTLPLGLANATIESQYRSDWGVAFAALVLFVIPPLIAYVFLQKKLTKGITMGAVKG
jgi:ABC-type glycerol-3-phosphate transport system permease component